MFCKFGNEILTISFDILCALNYLGEYTTGHLLNQNFKLKTIIRKKIYSFISKVCNYIYWKIQKIPQFIKC